MQALMEPRTAELLTDEPTLLPTVTFNRDLKQITLQVIISEDPAMDPPFTIHAAPIVVTSSEELQAVRDWEVIWNFVPADDQVVFGSFGVEIKSLDPLGVQVPQRSAIGTGNRRGEVRLRILVTKMEGAAPLSALNYDIGISKVGIEDTIVIADFFKNELGKWVKIHDPTIVVTQDPIGG
jgi:hypothetical protein